jgi:exonuclease III
MVNNQNNNKKSEKNEININNITINKEIKIATLNINGMSNTVKQLDIMKTIKSQNIDVMGLAETHTSNKNAQYTEINKKLKENNEYVCYWNNSDETNIDDRKGGVGIIASKKIHDHVYKVRKFKQYAIGIDVAFVNIKLNIIQIYMPTKEKIKIRKETEEQITDWINENQKTNIKTILIGDFNGVSNPLIDRIPPGRNNKPESTLLKFLEENFIDIYKWYFAQNTIYTWSNRGSSSRIDMAWMSQELIDDITHIFKPIDPLIKTDHKTLSFKIEILNKNWKESSNIKRKIYDWENAKEQNLKEYADLTNVAANKIKKDTNNINPNLNKINDLWNKIKKALINLSNKTIPTKTIKKHQYIYNLIDNVKTQRIRF